MRPLAARRWLCAVVVPLWLCCAPAFAQTTQPAQTGVVVAGSMTRTALPNGVWRSWINASGAEVLAANSGAIWFVKGASVWRYNIATGTVDVHTTRLTLPNLKELFMHRGAIAEDGRLVISCRAGIFLWDGLQWHSLPHPQSRSLNELNVGFDSQGQLWCDASSYTHRWDGRQWSASIQVAERPGGWHCWQAIAQTTEPGGRRATTQPTSRVLDELGKFSFRGRTYMTPAGVVAECRKIWDGPRSLYRIDPDGLTPLLDSGMGCLDLATGEVLRVGQYGSGQAPTVATLSGRVVAQLPPLPRDKDVDDTKLLFRDARGDYWCGYRRCDGKSWQAMLPPNAFLAGEYMREAIATGRLQYDEQKDTWVDLTAGQFPNVRWYNPERRTGWVFDWREADQIPRATRFMLGADGKLQQLASLKMEIRFPLFNVIEESGNVWFDGACRWDGKQVQRYYEGSTQMRSEALGIPRLLRSPSGAIWMYNSSRVWKRYNRERDRFEAADPREDFAFEVAGRRFSVAGDALHSGWDWNSDVGRVFVTDGQWKPLPDLFLQNDSITRGQHSYTVKWQGFPGKMVHDQRMLLNCSLGVFEWDVRADRWAYLSPMGDVWAYYDDKGRRVMVTSDNIDEILRYDGESFSAKQAAATQPVAPETLEARLRQLVQTMNTGSWVEGEAAARQTLDLLQQHPREVKAVLLRRAAWETYTPGTRSRISAMVVAGRTSRETITPFPDLEAKSLALRAITGNSLLERMHPPLPTVSDYTIRPGMHLEQAGAIFTAAGGAYSTPVHHTFMGSHPDTVGYMLPNGMLVYLKLDKPYVGNIVSIGFRAGTGFDPKWDWAEADMVPELKLQPDVSHYLE